jgi:lipoprotein-releasing system permease protein
MKISLLLNIALSLLLSRKKQTLVAAVGVLFGIATFIALLGFMNGLNDLLDGMILNRTPHVRLYNDLKASDKQALENALADEKYSHFIRSVKPGLGDLKIYNNEAIITTLKNDKRVVGVAPKVSTQVFYNVGSIDIAGVINGVEVAEEMRLYRFADYVSGGNPMDIANVPNSIILGKLAAQKMMAEVGDIIQVTTASGERATLKVVGFFQSGIQDFDKVQSFASIKTTQKLLGKENSYITDLQINLTDINMAPAVAQEFSKLFELDAVDIQTANSQFETGSRVRSIISYAVGITLLIVAGFGIYNILNMMIYEKMDTIAILKATGFSGADVRFIFISIALFIGIAGSMSGLLFGFILSSLIDQIPFNTAALPTVKTFPVNYDLKYYLIGTIFGFLTSYFAGYFPSRKASKVDAVVIIRGK